MPKVKSVSTQQAKAPLTGTTGLLVSTTPVKVFDIEGVCTGGSSNTAYYIQILGVAPASAVSGTTIPLWSRQITGLLGFSFVYRPIGLDTSTMTNPAGGTLATTGANSLPVYVAISSTDTVWTSTATATDCTVNYEETYLELVNQAIVGDTTTGRDSLTIWADPNQANRLTQFVVTNNSTAGYIMLFAYANPANGTLPLQQWAVGNGVTITEKFSRGIPFQQGDASFVPHYGAYLYGSSTTQTLTATSATQWTMQAFFTTVPE